MNLRSRLTNHQQWQIKVSALVLGGITFPVIRDPLQCRARSAAVSDYEDRSALTAEPQRGWCQSIDLDQTIVSSTMAGKLMTAPSSSLCIQRELFWISGVTRWHIQQYQLIMCFLSYSIGSICSFCRIEMCFHMSCTASLVYLEVLVSEELGCSFVTKQR